MDIGNDGATELGKIMGNLSEATMTDTAVAEKSARAITLGPASLIWAKPELLPHRTERRPGYPREGLWECAAFSNMTLRCVLSNKSYHEPPIYNLAVTLVFARIVQDAGFRWREVSLYQQFGQNTESEPTALFPNNDSFFEVFRPVVGKMALAHGPFLIDAEDEQSFIESWTGLFAKAAGGNLRPPRQLPLSGQLYE